MTTPEQDTRRQGFEIRDCLSWVASLFASWFGRQPRPVRVPPTQALIDRLKLEPTPRGARLMVLPLVRAHSGLIIDAEENREKPECGIVIRLGPGGVAPESGRSIPVVSQLGQVVWYGKYAGLLTDAETAFGTIPVYLMQESEVLMSCDGFALTVHDDDPRKAHKQGLICEHCAPKPFDRDALQTLAFGDVVDAEVPDEPSALIAQERERLITEREANPYGEHLAPHGKPIDGYPLQSE